MAAAPPTGGGGAAAVASTAMAATTANPGEETEDWVACKGGGAEGLGSWGDAGLRGRSWGGGRWDARGRLWGGGGGEEPGGGAGPGGNGGDPRSREGAGGW